MEQTRCILLLLVLRRRFKISIIKQRELLRGNVAPVAACALFTFLLYSAVLVCSRCLAQPYNNYYYCLRSRFKFLKLKCLLQLLRTSGVARGCDARAAQWQAQAPRVATMRSPLHVAVVCLLAAAASSSTDVISLSTYIFFNIHRRLCARLYAFEPAW